MFFQITLGDVIGWLITITSVGIAFNIKLNISRGNTKKINQSKSNVTGDQIGGDKIGGDKNGRQN